MGNVEIRQAHKTATSSQERVSSLPPPRTNSCSVALITSPWCVLVMGMGIVRGRNLLAAVAGRNRPGERHGARGRVLLPWAPGQPLFASHSTLPRRCNTVYNKDQNPGRW